MVLFLKAAGLGLLLAVPLGPIGLLCLRQSVVSGVGAGLAVGLGAATADAIYAAVAAFGLGAAATLISGAGWLTAGGGLVLIGLGLADIAFAARPAAPASPRARLGAYAGTVLLTLANPATILTFAAIIVGLGLLPDLASPIDGGIFVVGVFLGSTLWWIVLSALGGWVGGRLSPKIVPWARRIAGAVFVTLGLVAMVR